MQNHCAVFRDEEIMAEGKKLIEDIWLQSSDISVKDKSLVWNTDLLETLEFQNLISQAVVIVDGKQIEELHVIRARKLLAFKNLLGK